MAGATGSAAPVNFGQWAYAPVRSETFQNLFCLIFHANGQIMHLSIETGAPLQVFIDGFETFW